ncbi:MAG: ABC transporter ATP-binding protein [Rhodospirillales bacterium]|nr:ABC transporter ATP-binding protein [Rhodospirillales bacterium]
MAVHFKNLTKRYGDLAALDDFSLDIEPGGFTVIFGPPESGKSVLFRLLVGLEFPDSGQILFDGEDITHQPPANRHIGYVPQAFALYPHMSVHDNIGYPLALARRPKEEIRERVDKAANILSINHLLGKTPDQLSGGEKQRTAVARGLLKDAKVFVLDDPLVGLDYKLREQLMDELKSLRAELNATFIYATTDPLEALIMAQDLVLIDQGRVVQKGDVEQVYLEPQHAQTLRLVGFPPANMLEGKLVGGAVKAGPFEFRLEGDAGDGDVWVGLRPEAIHLDDSGRLKAQSKVRLVENLGGEFVVHFESEGEPLTTAFSVMERDAPEYGATVGISVEPADVLVFDRATGRRLGRGQG